MLYTESALVCCAYVVMKEHEPHKGFVCHVAHSNDKISPEWDLVETEVWKLQQSSPAMFKELVNRLRIEEAAQSQEDGLIYITSHILDRMCKLARDELERQGHLPAAIRQRTSV